MFDTPNPAFQQSVMKEDWLDSRAGKIKYLAAELLGLELKSAPAYVAERVKELHRKLGPATSEIQHQIRVRLHGGLSENPEQILHRAITSYRPLPYIGRLVFYKAAEGPTGDAWDYSRGWPNLITGEFEVWEVPVITSPCSGNLTSRIWQTT